MEGSRLTQVLHAIWLDGRLRVWGESLDAFLAHRVAHAPPPAERHPFASTHDALEAALADVSSPPNTGDDASSRGLMRLTLPHHAGRPLPSEDLFGLTDLPNEPTAGASLGSFAAPSIDVSAAAALPLLIGWTARSSPPRIELGADFRTLCDTASLAADLLIDQRFVPSLDLLAGSRVRARWTPWLDDPETQARLEWLVSGAPAVLRAGGAASRSSWQVLTEALRDMTDASVRRWLRAQQYVEAIQDRDPGSDRVVQFLSILLDGETTLVESASPVELFQEVRSWLSRLASPRRGEPWRLRLRVVEPQGAEAWCLALEMESTEREAESVRVADLWHGAALEPSIAARLGELQQAALREIARAARVYEPLQTAIAGSMPQDLRLSTEAMYVFLKEVAPVLQESGVSVGTPEWWGRPERRLSSRLMLNPVAEDGGGAGAGESSARMGLQSLVRFEWRLALADRTLTLEEFQSLAREGSPLVRIDNQWVEVRAEDVAAATALIEKGVSGVMTLREALQAAHGMDDHPASALPVRAIESSGWLSDLLEGRATDLRYRPLDQPRLFQGALRHYQHAGLGWLVFLDAFGLGACLADDMGLGKTIQLIALLQHERGQGDSIGPTLIIAPMSVVSNWTRELARFAPELSVHVHHGSERPMLDAFVSIASRADVVITTYSLVNRDVETLRRVRWRRVVLDEAQFVKNTPTKQAQAIRSLVTERRVALTGTPVENRLSELWSIMDFLNPGYLGHAAEFRRRFSHPIERRRDRERSDALRSMIRPFVLRRLKTDPTVVPDLPPLVETKEFAALTAEQARLYEEVVSGLLKRVDAAEGMQRRGLVLAGIVRLKQICNHPANLSDDADGAAENGESDAHDVASLAGRSGKVKRLLELFEEVTASGERALVFTQYRRMGHLLSRILHHELNVPVLFLHGGTPRVRRQEMIDQFQSETGRWPVFILSLRAGGVGLNLTAANHVFHFDRWWNPAVENQATDRAFRIGQQRTVHVHKLVCTGTLEERIDEMIEQKTELAESIVGAGDSWLTELSTSQLRELITLRQTAVEVEA
jgi:hypothetical protein